MQKTTKTLTLSILVAFAVIAVMGVASAISSAAPTPPTNTEVSGTVYLQSSPSTGVEGANVSVVCDTDTLNPQTTVTSVNGSYAVAFETACGMVYVTASKDGASNMVSRAPNNFGVVNDCILLLALVDVPLVPEFGMFMGMTTIIGALVAFFVIRRN